MAKSQPKRVAVNQQEKSAPKLPARAKQTPQSNKSKITRRGSL